MTTYRQYAQGLGLVVYASLDDLQADNPAPFDLVSMAHVLEHIPDPVAYLEKLRTDLLSPEGYLLLEVPNLYAHDCFEVAHLVSFSPNTLRQTVRKAGFEVLAFKQHGQPRSEVIPLYLTLLARPAAIRDSAYAVAHVAEYAVVPEHSVRLKRRLGMLRRQLILRIPPGAPGCRSRLHEPILTALNDQISVPLLTIFTAPKPFTDPHIATIQRNAIQSWLHLGPDVEVLLVGDEPGMDEAADQYGVKQLPDVRRNESGTPLVSSIFDLARRESRTPLLTYVNADVLLLPAFVEISSPDCPAAGMLPAHRTALGPGRAAAPGFLAWLGPTPARRRAQPRPAASARRKRLFHLPSVSVHRHARFRNRARRLG